MMQKIQTLFSAILILTTFLYADDQLSRGELLFKQCTGCHGTDGKNKAFGKSGIIAGQSSADLLQRLATYKEADFQKHGTSTVMAKQVKSLNTQDITALADYISKLKK